jgi:hypothetical protein
LDPRDSRHQEGLELAGIQVSPLRYFSMVVAWEFPISVWAVELRSWWVIDLDSNLLGRRVELHVGDSPRSAKAKDVLQEFFVLLLGFLSPKILSLPTQNPDGPELRLKFHCVKVIAGCSDSTKRTAAPIIAN